MQPPADVEVLDVHEVARIESADTRECLAANHHAGARDPVNLALKVHVVARALISTSKRIVGADESYTRVTRSVREVGEATRGRITRAVGTKHLWPNDSHVFVSGKRGQHRVDRSAFNDEVGITNQ